MAASELSEYVKRYTKLEHAIATLQKQQLALPNPSRWDDSNDQEFVKLYRRFISAKSVYAMCCTMSPERYHHWRVFTDKDAADGVCIEFRRKPLQAALNRMRNVRAQRVNYIPLKDLRASGPYGAEELPFIKRVGYRDEREWRILATSPDPQKALFEIPFSVNWVHRIILNPWMIERDRESARSMLKPLIRKPARITATYLRNSAEWKRLGKALVTSE
jgi:hypothetical protein